MQPIGIPKNYLYVKRPLLRYRKRAENIKRSAACYIKLSAWHTFISYIKLYRVYYVYFIARVVRLNHFNPRVKMQQHVRQQMKRKWLTGSNHSQWNCNKIDFFYSPNDSCTHLLRYSLPIYSLWNSTRTKKGKSVFG